jgi:hypothetical protein
MALVKMAIGLPVAHEITTTEGPFTSSGWDQLDETELMPPAESASLQLHGAIRRVMREAARFAPGLPEALESVLNMNAPPRSMRRDFHVV